MQHKSPLTPEAKLLLDQITVRAKAKSRGRIPKLLAKNRGPKADAANRQSRT